MASTITIEGMVECAEREMALRRRELNEQPDEIATMAAIVAFLIAVRDDPDAEPVSKVVTRRPSQASLF